MPLDGAIDDCAEPHLPHKLVADGYTHVIVRRGTPDARWFAARGVPDGLRSIASFDDSEIFAVTAVPAAIYTAALSGFSPREYDANRSWRWMAADAGWTIVNRTARPVVAVLGLEASAFHQSRHMVVRLDGRVVQVVAIEPSSRIHTLEAITIEPGAHELGFHVAEPPTVADAAIHNGDWRPLSFALGAWTWTVREEGP